MKKMFIMNLFGLIFLAMFIFFISLIIRALLKYINSKDIREDKVEFKKSLGEVLKYHRTSSKMTQEFVAEAVGVSRQAVSKWENGVSDPSTSNLLIIADLYGLSIEDLLKEVKR